MRRTIALLTLLAGPVIWPAAATAQDGETDRNRHDGFWYGLGAGAGWDRLSCDICAGNRLSGISGYGQIGGTLSDRVLLGGEVKVWGRSDSGVTQLLGAFSAVAIWYPRPTSALHFKGGFGYLAFRATDDETSLSTTSFGPQAGIGYDIAVGRNLSITPYANWMVTPFGDLTVNDTRVAGGVRSSLLQIGVGLTSH